MDRVVRFFAPKSYFDFAVKWTILLASVNLFNLIVEMPLDGWENYNLTRQLVRNYVVGGPFVALALAMLGHQRRLQAKLVELAATDVLTGLRNRRAFFNDATLAHSEGDGGAVLILDADYFKRINDTYGHEVGDLCLQGIARHLNSMVRDDDIVGRLGGEEFAIYLRNATAVRARAVGERICVGFNMDDIDTAKPIRLTLSAGAALTRTDVTIETGLAIADRALYLAKQAGRARVVFAPA